MIWPAKVTMPSRKSGMVQLVDEPGGSDTGHPGTDDGDALAEEVKLEVAVAKGSPCV